VPMTGMAQSTSKRALKVHDRLTFRRNSHARSGKP
jgi:hypothetical protein